jgi:threonine dehydratase
LFGCQCVIFIHADVSAGREQAMVELGAEVRRVDGNYDDSVREAARSAERHGWLVVSDTSYEGYIDIPRDITASSVTVTFRVMFLSRAVAVVWRLPCVAFSGTCGEKCGRD